MADIWKKMQTEYLKGGISYRQLAAKYGVSPSTLMKRARAEHWHEKRTQAGIKADAKTIEALSDQQAARAARLQTAADMLLDCVELALKDQKTLSGSAKAMQSVARTIKDIQEIQDIKSDLDIEEQKARIANLRKQAEKDDSNSSEISVVMEGDLKEYAQ